MTRDAIRCTVESMHYSACGLAPGDYFEVDADGLSVHAERGFCYFAIASVLPLLRGRHGADLDEWLASNPIVACPDPPEALHMRLERVAGDADGIGSLHPPHTPPPHTESPHT